MLFARNCFFSAIMLMLISLFIVPHSAGFFIWTARLVFIFGALLFLVGIAEIIRVIYCVIAGVPKQAIYSRKITDEVESTEQNTGLKFNTNGVPMHQPGIDDLGNVYGSPDS